MKALARKLKARTELNPKDDNSRALNKTSKFINEDGRVYNTLIPIRDGLMVCYKK